MRDSDLIGDSDGMGEARIRYTTLEFKDPRLNFDRGICLHPSIQSSHDQNAQASSSNLDSRSTIISTVPA